MSTFNIAVLATGLFGLGLFVGSMMSEIEEWAWGMVISPSRIGGLAIMTGAIIAGAINKFLL